MDTSARSSSAVCSSQPSTDTQKQVFAQLCASAPTASRTCRPFAALLANLGWVAATLSPEPAATETATVTSRKPLSLYTCGWWRKANASDKAELVQRVRNFAGGSVIGGGSSGDKVVGYGNVLTNADASKLFDERCSTSYAGAFALYKLYGAAAAFSVAQR